MCLLLSLLLLASPESERMLLGPSPFFRYEGMIRAVREDDRELLERAARSSLWDARRMAALGLESQTPVALLRDPVAVVREAALRGLDTAAPERDLLELIGDADDAVRARAAWALRGSRRRTAARKLFTDPSPTVRLAAYAGAGDIGKLRSAAIKGDLATSVGAYRALGMAGGATEASFLISRLSRAVKAAAKSPMPLHLRDEPGPELALARAVGDCARRGLEPGGRAVAVYLRRMLDNVKQQGNATILLAEAVAGARDSVAAGLILEAHLRSIHEKPKMRPGFYAYDSPLDSILHAYARDPWPGLAPLLTPLLAHKDAYVRQKVVAAMPPDSLGMAAADPSVDVRIAVCARLERVAELRVLADDRHPRVRAAAVRRLGRLGDPAGRGRVKECLDDLDPIVRQAAVGACLRLPVEDRGELLIRRALHDRDAKVRAAAAAVLGFLEEPSILDRAVAALLDGSPAVREHARDLLHALTSVRHAYEPETPEQGAGRWREWLKRKQNSETKASDAFRYYVEDLRRRGVDLVLVVDATGSMAPFIQATKRRLAEVMASLRRIVPDLRVRIIAYRDRGDRFITLSSPLTFDERLLEDFLGCVPAAGGGDMPEAVHEGLRQAIQKTPWRNKSHRLVLLFGDAPPHQEDLELIQPLVEEFSGAVHTVSVSGGSAGPQATSFRQIAEWGHGSFLQLAGADDIVRSILVLTLGPQHRAAIESLFGL